MSRKSSVPDPPKVVPDPQDGRGPCLFILEKRHSVPHHSTRLFQKPPRALLSKKIATPTNVPERPNVPKHRPFFPSFIAISTTLPENVPDPPIHHFHLVLPSFTQFYRVLLGFTQFYRVLLGFTRFYLVLLGFTQFYWVLPSFTVFFSVAFEFYRVLSCF